MSGSPFTVAQWQELEHQALIFKYLKAGLPVPPDLLAPIRKSFQLTSPRFFRHPTLGYCSYFGKKIDPEPGRCRRTDGKKWRCSKDAHPDSKYCERHMNRGRYRSRKLVELKTNSQSLSTVSSDIATGSNTSSGSFQNMPLHSVGNRRALCLPSQVVVDPLPYGISNNEYRCYRGLNPEAEKRNFLMEASGNMSLEINNTVDNSWRLMTSHVPMNSSEPRNSSLFPSNSRQLETFQDIEPLNVDAAMPKQEQYRCFFGKDLGSLESPKEEHQLLQPLFDPWPKMRDLGSHIDDHRSNKNLVTATQLSMSSPTASNLFARSAQSPNDAYG
ncbi:growth-regulating factor 4 isoform X2 [Ziziphus jujuba]|uniref:Growth-regulating factor n=2 Tax=Ziziphus jujuba TaxID=326968 RepID=A0A6P4AZ07_ZIZJJ|nr:growth-regulating factor 4 isoform X2 [Ziziphus jujuba]KAH7514800.1 hypothetical protein FEM48_Zijuj11G0129100 [Ziziphus jujuba var. spinosa]